MKFSMLIGLALLVSACASSTGERSLNHNALGSDEVIYLPEVENASMSATIKIMRDSRIWGAAMAPMLLVDGEEIAHMRNGTSLTFQLDPGSHLIGIRSLGNDMLSPLTLGLRRPTEIFELELTAEASGQYFFRIETRAGDEFTIQRSSY